MIWNIGAPNQTDYVILSYKIRFKKKTVEWI